MCGDATDDLVPDTVSCHFRNPEDRGRPSGNLICRQCVSRIEARSREPTPTNLDDSSGELLTLSHSVTRQIRNNLYIWLKDQKEILKEREEIIEQREQAKKPILTKK